jgi:hypothetical protein
VDPVFVEDVILREQQNPQEQPMYTIEVFSDGSRNPEDVKKDILADTGMTPSIHDHGTHYVINHKKALKLLREYKSIRMSKRSKGNIPAAPLQVELRTNAENAIMAESSLTEEGMKEYLAASYRGGQERRRTP